MNPSRHTTGGTAVYEPSAKDFERYLDARAQKTLGMTSAEFTAAYERGELDPADPAVSELASLLQVTAA